MCIRDRNGEELVGAIEVPIDGLLSFIATNDFNAEIIGLDQIPEDEQPPVAIVHIAFITMVGIGTALAGLASLAAWRALRRRDTFLDSPLFLWALVLAGPAAVLAMETGWITTEVGRQPWIVHGLLRTEDAVTDAGYIWVTLSVLIVVYTVMTVGAIGVIRSMSRRWRAGETDLPSPYGPTEIEKLVEQAEELEGSNS